MGSNVGWAESAQSDCSSAELKQLAAREREAKEASG